MRRVLRRYFALTRKTSTVIRPATATTRLDFFVLVPAGLFLAFLFGHHAPLDGYCKHFACTISPPCHALVGRVVSIGQPPCQPIDAGIRRQFAKLRHCVLEIDSGMLGHGDDTAQDRGELLFREHVNL